jgi:hypothetical protein
MVCTRYTAFRCAPFLRNVTGLVTDASSLVNRIAGGIVGHSTINVVSPFKKRSFSGIIPIKALHIASDVSTPVTALTATKPVAGDAPPGIVDFAAAPTPVVGHASVFRTAIVHSLCLLSWGPSRNFRRALRCA